MSWIAIVEGAVAVPAPVGQGEFAVFERGEQAVEVLARSDVDFVLGSAAPHAHDLVLGGYSVHTSPAALHEGETRIAALRKELDRLGRP